VGGLDAAFDAVVEVGQVGEVGSEVLRSPECVEHSGD
jgi:hypothetical protein